VKVIAVVDHVRQKLQEGVSASFFGVQTSRLCVAQVRKVVGMGAGNLNLRRRRVEAGEKDRRSLLGSKVPATAGEGGLLLGGKQGKEAGKNSGRGAEVGRGGSHAEAVSSKGLCSGTGWGSKVAGFNDCGAQMKAHASLSHSELELNSNPISNNYVFLFIPSSYSLLFSYPPFSLLH
jgi:hypothetical protein